MARNRKMAQPWYYKVNINNIYAGFTALFLLAAFVFFASVSLVFFFVDIPVPLCYIETTIGFGTLSEWMMNYEGCNCNGFLERLALLAGSRHSSCRRHT